MLAVAISSLLFFAGDIPARPNLPPQVPHQEAKEDPFWVPEEMLAFARKNTLIAGTNERHISEALLRALMLPADLGGMGITYSNDRTRTISDVWLDRKANCISLTMAYIMLAKQLRIHAVCAESLGVMNWSRVGNLILRHKHVVALVQRDSQGDLVADFLPSTRVRFGNYFLEPMSETRAKSLFYSNCAVESFLLGDVTGAREMVQTAIDTDPTSSQAWNILGVLEKSENNIPEALMAYRIAIHNNPKDVAALSNLAVIYKDEGRYFELARIRTLEKRLRNSDPYYYAFLASEAIEVGDLKKAQKYLLNAIKIHPIDPDFYMTLCVVYEVQQKFSDAIKALEKARKHALEERIEVIDDLIKKMTELKDTGK
ncbi:MAG: tetratricopeptide repeat protein [Holophagaceae bacterium]|nr:tetratricopeptide repeat protein [Holophagaceae bacterium]